MEGVEECDEEVGAAEYEVCQQERRAQVVQGGAEGGSDWVQLPSLSGITIPMKSRTKRSASK